MKIWQEAGLTAALSAVVAFAISIAVDVMTTPKQ